MSSPVSAYRTLEMVTLIFLLFVGFNGGHQCFDTVQAEAVPTSTTELVVQWGQPDDVATAEDVGFASAQMTDVEVWSYASLQRTAIVRDDEVISIREG